MLGAYRDLVAVALPGSVDIFGTAPLRAERVVFAALLRDDLEQVERRHPAARVGNLQRLRSGTVVDGRVGGSARRAAALAGNFVASAVDAFWHRGGLRTPSQLWQKAELVSARAWQLTVTQISLALGAAAMILRVMLANSCVYSSGSMRSLSSARSCLSAAVGVG